MSPVLMSVALVSGTEQAATWLVVRTGCHPLIPYLRTVKSKRVCTYYARKFKVDRFDDGGENLFQTGLK